jgi:hypothetical protein
MTFQVLGPTRAIAVMMVAAKEIMVKGLLSA